MATFNLKKGEKFVIEKAITNVLIAAGWDEDKKNKFDVDLHAFGCVNQGNGPKFYNDASHAVTYANPALIKSPNGSFATADGSINHSGDNQSGKGEGDDEVVRVDFNKLPADINELCIFLTLHEAAARKQDFSLVQNSFIRIDDVDAGKELCRFDLRNEFAGMVSVQVASFVKNDGKWSFSVLGAGLATEELEDILGMLQ